MATAKNTTVNTTTEETMDLSTLIAIFGPEVGQQMWEEQQASQGTGGVRLPFTTLDKISDVVSELGAFGTYVYGVTKEKDAATQEYVVTNTGTNVGKAFQFLPVSIFYRYKRWNETTKRTEYSSVFKTNSEGETAVDYKGVALPAGKDAKRDAGYSMQKVVVGLVRQDSSAKFVPVIWEITGKLFFTYNNVEKKMKQPILGGIINVVTKLEKQGSTNYSVIDENATTVSQLPLAMLQEYKTELSEITTKTREYVTAKLPKAGGNKPVTQEQVSVQEDTDTDTGGNW